MNSYLFTKKYQVMIIFTLLFSLFMLATASAEEDSLPNFYEVVDNETVEEIRNQIDLPLDYDVNRAIMGMEYLVNVEEFSITGAAGLIGNGFAESRLLLNPGRGYYKGLFQWDGRRRWPKVKKYLEDNSVDFENEEELYIWQLSAAIHSEDAENYQETIEYCKLSDSAEKSAEQWCRKFEGTRSAVATRKKIARLTVAVYEIYLEI